MMEVRPNLTQEVSVATIKILKTLRLFDFCYVDPEEEVGKSLDLSIISTLSLIHIYVWQKIIWAGLRFIAGTATS